MFGRKVESAMDVAESRVSKNLKSPKFKEQARRTAMARILDGPGAKGQFRDPVATKTVGTPKVKKEDKEPEVVPLSDSFGG